jgi:hypothetical protein
MCCTRYLPSRSSGTVHRHQNLRHVVSGQRIRDCLVLIQELDISFRRCLLFPASNNSHTGLGTHCLHDLLNIRSWHDDWRWRGLTMRGVVHGRECQHQQPPSLLHLHCNFSLLVEVSKPNSNHHCMERQGSRRKSATENTKKKSRKLLPCAVLHDVGSADVFDRPGRREATDSGMG